MNICATLRVGDVVERTISDIYYRVGVLSFEAFDLGEVHAVQQGRHIVVAEASTCQDTSLLFVLFLGPDGGTYAYYWRTSGPLNLNSLMKLS